MKPVQLKSFLSRIVTLLVPVVLVLLSVRALMTPAFLHFEYNTPGFPLDPFGFSKEERLYWSKNAVEYLINDEDISYLKELKFDTGYPVYNERELQHMVDVKNVVQKAMIVMYTTMAGLFILGLWAYFGNWRQEYFSGLGYGGTLTIVILVSLILFVLVAFGIAFVAFHNIFFESGTWRFNYNDTLIRLFPERFWRDTFIVVGALASLPGLILGLIFKRKPKRKSE